MIKKAIWAIPLFLCGINLFSQIYTPTNPTVYGSNNNRVRVIDAIGFPTKDTTLSTNDLSAQIFYRPQDSSFWGFSQDKRFFKIGSGGSSTLPSWLDSVGVRVTSSLDSTKKYTMNWRGDTLLIEDWEGDGSGGGGGGITQSQLDDTASAIRSSYYIKSQVDAFLSGKENSLGNPSANGYVLSSTTSGVRSWVPMSGGSTPSLQDVATVDSTIRSLYVNDDGNALLFNSGLTFIDYISADARGKLSFYDGKLQITNRFGKVSILYFKDDGLGGSFTQYTIQKYEVGSATLVSGTVDVTVYGVTSSSKAIVTVSTPGGTRGFLSAICSTDKITITSTSSTETSVVNYVIYFNP